MSLITGPSRQLRGLPVLSLSGTELVSFDPAAPLSYNSRFGSVEMENSANASEKDLNSLFIN